MSSVENIVNKIRESVPPGSMTTRVIAVDGPGGAGKSTLTESIAEQLKQAPIIHTDDFASWEEPLNWWPRLLEQVLKPLSQNQPAHYQRYDWGTKQMAEWHNIEPTEYIILEGVSAVRKAFQPYLSFSVWVETPRHERLRRGLARDGQEAEAQWEKWMAREDDYIASEKPQDYVDVVFDGTK